VLLEIVAKQPAALTELYYRGLRFSPPIDENEWFLVGAVG